MKHAAKWDNRFIELAEHIATWSKDPSTQCGSVITDNKHRIVSVGFNGFPQGIPDDDLHDREKKYPKIIHAEQNCMAFSFRDISGYTLYCTHCPCSQCASMIIQRGIVRVVFYRSPAEFEERWKKSNEVSLGMFSEAGVEVMQINKECIK